MICKKCQKEKPISEFYPHNQVRTYKGSSKLYECYLQPCKCCIREMRRKKYENPIIRRTSKRKETGVIEKWIIKLLTEHGNCYVRKQRNIQELEEVTHFKLKIRPTSDNNGFVIERIK